MKCFISSSRCNFLSINAWVKTCHVMVIALFLAFGIGTVVAQPSIIKSPAAIAGDEMTKLSNGGLHVRESGFEESVLVFRPVSSDRVESAKLGNDSGAELGGSGVKFIEPEVKVSHVADKTGKQNRADNDVAVSNNVGDKFWHWIVIFLICISPYIGYAQREVDTNLGV
ncbi:hypothetical protein Mmol_1380 [Methylotenera mobilis JLW8]|uniref:Uncharacterized protein n=1 Tax=Methylotenera mobilis (strain JLW8 / ATCC BAA-1282 / DSM 17540) TaxID=583345 RepID=C6WWI7_METML|nr:hypothetical protein Mmol_1380 [Methylotenera mobilis JLW8]